MRTKLFLILAVAIIGALASCANGSSQKAQQKFDIEKLKEMSQRNTEMTSEDYDFLLDQMEALAIIMEKMTPEEREARAKETQAEEALGLIVIGFSLDQAESAGKLSPEQQTRYNELQKRFN